MRKILVIACLLVCTSACDLVQFTADQTAQVLKVAAPSLNMESDPQLAREAAPGQLKTVEGFLLATPHNRTLIAILAQGYCEYSFGFLQDDVEELQLEGKDDEAKPIADRATHLYLRCMNYGLKLLDSSWEKALYGSITDFQNKVKHAGHGDVEGMFWTALGLASAINLNRDDSSMLVYLAKAQLMMERVAELDSGFYHGEAHMALGMIYTALPPSLGGRPEDGKAEFEKADQITGGKFLMIKTLEAINIGQTSTDEEHRKFFHDTLVKVLHTNPAVWPEQRLANELAQIRARQYLAHEKELFHVE